MVAVEQAMKAERGSRGISSTFSLTSELYGGGWLTPCLGRFTPRKETRYPSCGRVGGHQGRSGRVRKISPSFPYCVSTPGCPVHSTSLIPTELSWPTLAAVIIWQSLVTRVNIGSVVQGEMWRG